MSVSLNLSDYILDKNKRIGRGSSGIVYQGQHKITQQIVAIKQISIGHEDIGPNSKLHKLLNEIQIMKKLKHHNVITLYNVQMDLDKGFLYLIMEYCNGPDLATYINENILNMDDTHDIMGQIKEGLKYLRQSGILHRDLKPDNILLSNSIIKIADFGLSTYADVETDLISTICGSPLYMSPEIIEHKKYNIKSDLWSIGIILYKLIYRTHPYPNCKNLQELTHQIKFRPIDIPTNPPLDSLTLDLLQGLLNKDSLKRITWDEFLNHTWFKYIPSTINLNENIFDLDLDNSIGNKKTKYNLSQNDKKLKLSSFIVNDYNKYKQPHVSSPIAIHKKTLDIKPGLTGTTEWSMTGTETSGTETETGTGTGTGVTGPENSEEEENNILEELNNIRIDNKIDEINNIKVKRKINRLSKKLRSGTSAPVERKIDKSLEYSPLHNLSSSLITYMSDSYTWLKNSIQSTLDF